ncbi:TetR/AcrR family transcriptional regulator [Actinocrispum wychmicini]|nr:TetR/AcrR family transcriptional regulator [Actinocrispum wychmicini]
MTPKRGYHHGDLRNALIEAAGTLAEENGPQAITVRAAARAAGVTPTAAYRHFENHEELLHAAAEQALERLAESMREQIQKLPDIDDPPRAALSNLAAVARGYIQFAIAEPGLFRTAFTPGGKRVDATDLGTATPVPDDAAYGILMEGLDRLVDVGHLTNDYRPFAEITAWSAVHGFAMLVIDGPLSEWPEEALDAAMARMFAILVRGLTGTALSDQLAADVLAAVS